MKRISKSKASAQMNEWARCVNKDIPQLFDRFFENKVGIKNQWHRLTAIRFGEVTQSFATDLSEADKVSLCLGVVKNKEKESFRSFNLLVRIHKKNSKKDAMVYYQCRNKPQNLSDDPLQPGLVYGAVESPEKSGTNSANKQLELVGIRSALKNQYCSNWCMVDSDRISELFQAEQPDLRGKDRAELLFHEYEMSIRSSKNAQESGNTKSVDRGLERQKGELIVYNPFNRARVRGLWYEVNGYSLEVLKKKLKKRKGCCMTINLGMNPGGVYFNKNQFSLVLEVITKQRKVRVNVLDRWETGLRNGKAVENLLLKLDNVSEPLYAPNLVLNEPPYRFWLNNEFVQGEVKFGMNRGTGAENLEEANNFEFTLFVSTFDDFLHPCPPYCGDPPGTGGNG